MELKFEYGMRLRGFSIGCQPKQGFLERKDDPTGKYHDIIVYDRPLTAKECEEYELDGLNVEKEEVSRIRLKQAYELYESNEDFQKYVDNFCRERNEELDYALRCVTVREVAAYYKELSERS